MSVSYSSNRVTIGTYKSGTTVSNSTTTLLITSGGIVSGDIGRLVMVQPSTSDSSQTQVRLITGVSGGTISIDSPWVGTIASGTTWKVAHTCADVHAIGDANLQKVGASSYRWNADWSVTGFFGDTDISLEMATSSATAWPISTNAVVQFGVLDGGEANGSTETILGCRLYFDSAGSNQNVYSATNARVANGGVTNYYGCLIESDVGSWMFQRMTGPTRFIGCLFDGKMGGRFYHEATEWVQCRHSGNNNATPAWSIGATFTRDIESVFFFQNLVAMKNYQSFGGTLRLCTFADSNTDVFNVGGNTDSIFNFIDSTEFDDTKIIDAGSGILNQYRSVSFTITDSGGAALSGVNVRVNDKNDTTQSSVETSDGSGVCGEILALRRKWENANPSVTYNPFRIRIRGYGYLWGSLNSAIADPIKQSYAMRADVNVSESSGTALAHTGITVTDHGGSPVTWNAKSWGITVTGNRTTNPSLTVANIKHYLHYHLSQDATFNSKASGLLWHNLIPMAGTATENGTYGSTTKGVRVIDENGDPFPGVTNMQSDDGTYYTPPTTVTLTVSGLQTGSRVRIEKTSDGTLISQGTESGGQYTDSYIHTADVTVTVKVRLYGYIPYSTSGTITANGLDVTVSQITDTVVA